MFFRTLCIDFDQGGPHASRQAIAVDGDTGDLYELPVLAPSFLRCQPPRAYRIPGATIRPVIHQAGGPLVGQHRRVVHRCHRQVQEILPKQAK